MNKNDKIKNYLNSNIDKIKEDYQVNELSIANLSLKYKVCESSMSAFLKANDITRDKKKITSKKSTEAHKRKLDELIDEIGIENLRRFYIDENHTIEEVQAEFNLTNWMATKLLKYLEINKPRSESTKIGLQTKYDKFGGKDAYDKYMHEKQLETIINNGLTVKEHYKRVADKCSKAWSKKTINDIETIVSKRNITCLERYDYPFACMRPEARSKGNNSKPNQAFDALMKETFADYSSSDREFVIDNNSYDFKYKNNLIEINPTATHNSTFGIYDNPATDKYYHYNKTKLACDNNYRCINVWDWDDIDKVLMLLTEQETIYARKCKIKEVDKKEAKEFIDNYHIQGYAKDDIRIGLYYNNELVSIMTFNKPRYNKKYQYELIRYCSIKSVIGGAEKLFKYFIKTYTPDNVISYCDLSKFSGKTYIKLGFKLERVSISKHWYNMRTKQHITDNFLRQRGYDQIFGTSFGKGTSNEQLMLENGFVVVYDAGQATYVYTKEQ